MTRDEINSLLDSGEMELAAMEAGELRGTPYLRKQVQKRIDEANELLVLEDA